MAFEIEADIPDIGKIVIIENTFAGASMFLEGNGYSLISLKELAEARIKKGKYHSLSLWHSIVAESVIYCPRAEHRRILVRDPITMVDAFRATEDHRTVGQFYLPKTFSIDKYLEQIDKEDYFYLDDLNTVPTSRFGIDPKTVWTFGNIAQDYGNFLSESGIKELNFSLREDVDKSASGKRYTQPYVNQLYMHRINRPNNSRVGTPNLAGPMNLTRGIIRYDKTKNRKPFFELAYVK